MTHPDRGIHKRRDSKHDPSPIGDLGGGGLHLRPGGGAGTGPGFFMAKPNSVSRHPFLPKGISEDLRLGSEVNWVPQTATSTDAETGPSMIQVQVPLAFDIPRLWCLML